jgi:hypothetical protein
MTETLIEPGNVQRSILAEFRKRINPDMLEHLFVSTTLLAPSMGRTNYLRQIVRESMACDEHFNALANYCKQHTGSMFGRRAAFRMGICLGILMAEQIPRDRAPQQTRVMRPGYREKLNRVEETSTFSQEQAQEHDREAVEVEA